MVSTPLHDLHKKMVQRRFRITVKVMRCAYLKEFDKEGLPSYSDIRKF